MLNILLVYYSQTGQLERVVRSVGAPLEQAQDVRLTFERLEPEKNHPFPWLFWHIADIIPETSWLDPPPLKPLNLHPTETGTTIYRNGPDNPAAGD